MSGADKGSPRSAWLATLLVSASLVAAATGSAGGGPVIRFERAPASAFPGGSVPRERRALDIVASDMDLDGDPDVLINWHVYGHLELFENRQGRLVPVDPTGDDASGLTENHGVPELFAEADAVESRITAANRAGLHVWHDTNAGGSWRFLWSDREARYGGLHLELETSARFVDFEGVAPDEIERLDERRVRLALPSGERRFAARTYPIGVQLVLRLAAGPSRATPPLYAGAELVSLAAERAELWKPDPHGMAWVDVEGTAHPELFVTRGALGGHLAPPADPKADRYYVHTGGNPPYRMADDGVVPRSFARGRRVEWVDVDNDGSAELSVANESSPNALLARVSGRFHDEAPRLGLDLIGGSVQAWGDLDGDGRQDLLLLDGSELRVAWNRADGFELESARSLGLVLPPVPEGEGLFDRTVLRLADFDADGDLDVWVLSRGPERTQHLFLREAGGFRDVSQSVGLDRVRGQEPVVLLDVDNDGFEDAVGFGARAVVWWNRGGRRFEFHPLPLPRELGRTRAATVLDVDGDGRTDLALVGRIRLLLLNATAPRNGFLDVIPRDGVGAPIGTLVRALYSDGRGPVQRLGSATNSCFSQSIQPLRFGIPPGVRLERLAVTWPGDRGATFYAVERTDTSQVVQRGGQRAARAQGR